MTPEAQALCSATEIAFLKKHPALVMVSGGPDSVFLLRCFLAWREAHGIAFEVLHVNHHLRGPQSDAEEKFVRELCRRNKIRGHVRHFRWGGDSGNLQDGARQARIRFAFEVAAKRGLKCVATAHHADDMLETLCMRAARGAGITGLCGIRRQMRRRGEQGSLLWLRPLSSVSKQEILTALKKIRQSFCKDSSNLSQKYFRNRVRRDLGRLPANQKKILLELSGALQSVDDYFDRRTRFLLRRYGRVIPDRIWQDWSREIQFRYFQKGLRECGYLKQVQQKHFELMLHKQKKIVLGPACCEIKKDAWRFSRVTDRAARSFQA